MPLAHPSVWSLPLRTPPRIDIIGFGKVWKGQRFSYRFDDLWSLHLYRYRCRMSFGLDMVELAPGMAGLVPPGTPFTLAYPHQDGLHPYALFRLAADGPVQRVPAALSLAGDAAPLWTLMAAAIADHPLRPQRAECRLWEVLWRLAERSDLPDPTDLPEQIQRTIERIAAEPGRPPSVALLARAVGLAPDSLSRLFRAHLGVSVRGWIQRRRRERLSRLLAAGGMSLRSIAEDLGCGDLQELNKLSRKWLGAAPTRLPVAGGEASK
jgi:AraC-like DNA-binding protein